MYNLKCNKLCSYFCSMHSSQSSWCMPFISTLKTSNYLDFDQKSVENSNYCTTDAYEYWFAIATIIEQIFLTGPNGTSLHPTSL